MATYRTFVEQLTSGIAYLRAHYGQRWSGYQGLVFDLLAEGLRYGFLTRLPGYENLPSQTISLQGLSLLKFERFRLETDEQFLARMNRVWEAYAQAGTSIQVGRALHEWGRANYGWVEAAETITPTGYSQSPITITEGPWAYFQIGIADGFLPWTEGELWGDFVWGDGTFWGIGNADIEDVSAFMRAIRKWKPSRSIAQVTVINGANTVTFEVR